jgi:predicted nucleic acid-binding protein
LTFVLDSWAVLRLLEGADPAATRVQSTLDDGTAVMSWINLGEVFYIVRRLHGRDAAESVVRDLRPLLDLDLPDQSRVIEAAAIKADHAMAYADAFAAATAIGHDATLLTGDPELLLADSAWRHEDLRRG